MFNKNDKVRHNFSGNTGRVLDVRKNEQGYDILVEWDGILNSKDWYQRKVLIKL